MNSPIESRCGATSGADYHFGLLDPEQTLAAWPHIRPLLARATSYMHGEYEVDDVLDMVSQGKMSIFVMLHRAEIVTALGVEISTFRRVTTMNIALLGGRDLRILHERFADRLIRFARECGATRITAFCRPAAERMFNRMAGSETIYRVIAKEI